MDLQSSTVKGFAARAGLIYIFSAAGVDVYRQNDWTRVAWAALSGVTCGAINDAGIWLGTSLGVWFLPFSISGASSHRLFQALTATTTPNLQSNNVLGLAGRDSALLVITASGVDFILPGAVTRAVIGSLPGACAIDATRIAYAVAAGFHMLDRPSVDWDASAAMVLTSLTAPALLSDTVQTLDFAGDLVIGTAGGITLLPSAYALPPSSPLAHYRMETAGATLTDVTGNNNGTITGTPTVETGTLGNALRFDGSTNYATLPDALKVAYPLTICARVWPGMALSHVVCASGDVPVSFGLDVSYNPTFRIKTADNGYSGHTCTGGPVAAGELLIWSYDGAAFKAYRGTPATGISECVNVARTGAIAYGAQTGGYMMAAYKAPAGTITPYPGKIDEVRFYNRILTSDEMTALLDEGAVLTTELGSVVDTRAIHLGTGATKAVGLLAYGTADEDGGRFGVLDLATGTNKTTVDGDTLAVWADEALTAAIHDTALVRYRLVAEISPAANATGVRRDWTLYTEITDTLGGIETGTVALTVNGVSQTPTVAAVTNGFAVTYIPAGNSGYNERVTIGLSGTDSDGNTVSRTWVFTTAGAPALTASDASPPNVVCKRNIGLSLAESDEIVDGVNVVWLDTHTSPLIVTEAQAREVGRVKIDETTYHKHKVGVRVLATDSGGLQTRDLRPGSIVTITCNALGMTAQKCEILAAQRTIDDSDEDISFDLQAAYYEQIW
jgi:hypothetical protein